MQEITGIPHQGPSTGHPSGLSVKAFDKPQESQGGFVGTTEVAEVDVTGSITFVADDEAFSNMLWISNKPRPKE